MDAKSFFKKLLGTVEREVQTEVNRAKYQVKQQIQEQQAERRQQAQQQQQAQQPQQQSQPQPQAQNTQRPSSEAEWVVYFRDILRAEFLEYVILENIEVKALAGDANDTFKLYADRPLQAYKAEWGKPYSFVLYQGVAPKAVVMLGKGHSHDTNVKYLISRKYAQKIGVPYINFYTQMPNERDYVVARIKKMMG